MGLIATEHNEAELVHTTLQAIRRGYEVFVTYASESEPETIDLARLLDARIVEPDYPGANPDSLLSTLATTARRNGCPGLIYQFDVSTPIDYGRSERELADRSSYTIEAETSHAREATPEIVVGIPAYNEAESIASVVEGATNYADLVVVVDDGSRDDTAARAREAGATVIEHEYNGGYGSALKSLFQEAARRDAEHLVILDADDQHTPTDVPKLVATQGETDAEIVIGSRFVKGAHTDAPLYRRFGLFVVNALTNFSIGAFMPSERITDTQSGFRAYNARAIKSLANDDEIGDRMHASTDILYHAHQRGYTISETGITVRYDVENASSESPLSHGYSLVNNISTTVQNAHPMLSLGLPGTGSILVAVSVAYWFVTDFLATGSPSFLLATFTVMFGFGGFFACVAAIILHALRVHERG
ncbi:glycosyltransferase family 2 protein [Halalkalicoccus sp. GCM10025322]|uniref:glycosyltransferase family 2 protein n=1 Tax=Halalkalicoccus TaxID=332246 RepID=UPI002F968DDB